MPQGSNIIAFFMMAFGQTLGADQNLMDRLKDRIQLRQVYSEDESDVVIAFVAIVSRAATDIGAALDRIPSNRPVILVVLHHTFDPYYVAPESRLSVNRNNVLAVDCLFHEDQGLMRCLRNDEVLKVVTDRLIDLGGSPGNPLLPIKQQTLPRCYSRKCLMIFSGAFVVFFLTFSLIFFLIFPLMKAHNVTGGL